MRKDVHPRKTTAATGTVASGRAGTGAFAVFCLLALSACSSTLGPVDSDLQRIRAQRALWDAQEISSYTFETRRLCFCAFVGWLEVTVAADSVVSILPIDDPEAPEWATQDYPTINELFDILEDAVEREAVQIDMTWHESLGYPESFWIDYALNVADEELGHDVRLLTPN